MGWFKSAAAQALADQWDAAGRDLRQDPGNPKAKARVRAAYNALVERLEQDDPSD